MYVLSLIRQATNFVKEQTIQQLIGTAFSSVRAIYLRFTDNFLLPEYQTSRCGSECLFAFSVYYCSCFRYEDCQR